VDITLIGGMNGINLGWFAVGKGFKVAFSGFGTMLASLKSDTIIDKLYMRLNCRILHNVPLAIGHNSSS
jgi:hypothetical protein